MWKAKLLTTIGVTGQWQHVVWKKDANTLSWKRSCFYCVQGGCPIFQTHRTLPGPAFFRWSNMIQGRSSLNWQQELQPVAVLRYCQKRLCLQERGDILDYSISTFCLNRISLPDIYDHSNRAVHLQLCFRLGASRFAMHCTATFGLVIRSWIALSRLLASVGACGGRFYGTGPESNRGVGVICLHPS